MTDNILVQKALSGYDHTKQMTQEEARQELVRNYVPVVMEHIAKHGCSGLKCKRCPLNNICDKNAAKSKELANQMIVYANTQRAKDGV